MDAPLALHRCRFVDFTPSPITAIAFPPLPLPKKPSSIGKQPERYGTLAVGHANGNIDLCEWAGGQQSPQSWTVRTTLSGPYPSKVDSLVFAIRYPDLIDPTVVPSSSDLRLFSSGGGSDLLEWDMDRGCVRRTISSQGGSIWSISVNPASNIIALGCEDGTVRLLSIANDTLSHYRRFDRVKCRVLSIAWGPPIPKQNKTITAEGSSDEDEDDEYWTDSWLVTGGSDSSLRKWDVKSGRSIDRMGTDKIRGERTLVWAVGVLGDGTIVSGDSMGLVKFWDSRTCTQLQSFQAHGADVLCLTIDPTGTAVYTAGVDQKLTQFCFINTSTGDKGKARRWIQTSSRRLHSHDIRALAMWPPYSTLPSSHKRLFPVDIAPLLISGGLDMSVVVTPAALPTSTVVKIVNPISTSVHCTFEDSYHRRLAYTPGPSSIQVAREARLISCTRDSGLELWRIPRKASSDEAAGWEKILTMDLNVHTNLLASAISTDGKWLATSDLYESKLFSLVSDSDGCIAPRRVRDFSAILRAHLPPKSTSSGAFAFHFTADSSKLVISTATGAFILVVDLGKVEQPRVLRRFDQHRMASLTKNRVVVGRSSVDEEEPEPEEEEEEHDFTPIATSILRLATSFDGQWLASSDVHGRTHVFNLDSVQHHCVLPSFPLAAQSICFDPSRPSVLVLAFPDNSIQIFDVEARQFPPWGKEICDNLPKRLTRTHDHILGVTFDPAMESQSSTPRSMLLWGSTWLCKLRLERSDTTARSAQRKRRRDDDKSPKMEPVDDYLKMVTHYRPILHLDFLGAGEVVVVERPLVDVLATLPPAYFVHKYGT
ncbi:WD-REPEATS-REGION domain-containing protein [Mycena indigotica]|uniref:WD-REPEATS-REGION domain-containing protein n=1 Tax=Mycena indigotica TaxID=2126181 RepID=A0A8H6SWM7_9AGAR|nr:WD-REPEATS-REGION domain-containing protein [Mycena indigotica]KAF7306724.1 WD-REPEATS-REGION domain-containing protein [Mycena indigotica]